MPSFNSEIPTSAEEIWMPVSISGGIYDSSHGSIRRSLSAPKRNSTKPGRILKPKPDSKKESVTFVDITIWGKTAENCGQYLKKGRPVLISGRLESSEWHDKQTGQKRQKLGVIAETVQFLGGRDDAAPAKQAQPAAPVAGDGPTESDDIPF